MTTDTAVNALSLALAAARRDGIEVRSIKDLLCDGCGTAVALVHGLCHRCNDEMREHYSARDTFPADDSADDPATLPFVVFDGEGPGAEWGGAEHCAAAHDDPEGANYLAGIRS
jgi:hypothetical protein